MTFENIVRWVQNGESDLEDGEFAIMLIQNLAEALDAFEHNTARMFAVYSVSAISEHPELLQRQIRERTVFALEELRRRIP